MIEEMKQKDAWKRTGNDLEQLALKMKSKMCNTPAEKRELDGQIMLIRNAAALLISGAHGTARPKTEKDLRNPFESVSDVLDRMEAAIDSSCDEGGTTVEIDAMEDLYKRLRNADERMRYAYNEAVDDCGKFIEFVHSLYDYVNLMRNSGDAVRMALTQYLQRDLRMFKHHRIAIKELPSVIRKESADMAKAIAEMDELGGGRKIADASARREGAKE